MKPRTFFYNVRQGFKGIFRNSVMSIASMLVLVACMVLVATFYIVIDTIDVNIKNINDLNTIEIMLNKNYTEDQVGQIREALEIIRESSPIIEGEVVYVSEDEHLELLRNMYPDSDWIADIIPNSDMEQYEGTEDYGDFIIIDNPLRASFRLQFSNIADIDAVSNVKTRIDSIKIKDENGELFDAVPTSDIKDCIDLYGNVISVKNTLYFVGLWLLAILLLLSLFVIMNTIKLGVFARRNEIMFMRLCGATKSMVRMPYIVEGIIIGMFSAAISFGIVYYLYEYLFRDVITSAMSSSTGKNTVIADFSHYIPLIGIGFIVLGLFAGIVSSSISLKKYLKA